MEKVAESSMSKEFLEAVRGRKALEEQLQTMRNKISHMKHEQEKEAKQEEIKKQKLDYKAGVRAKHEEHLQYKKSINEEKERLLSERKKSIAQDREERKNSCKKAKEDLEDSHRRSRSNMREQSNLNGSFIKTRKEELQCKARLRVNSLIKRELDFKEQKKVKLSTYRDNVKKGYIDKINREKKSSDQLSKMIQKLQEQEMKEVEEFLSTRSISPTKFK